ncbi:MAG: 3-phosphoglycerate dehydrogenase [Clostridiales bacterium]|nr:3-phosphoglycerate dehydrogenase [Clostridiales bacterium]
MYKIRTYNKIAKEGINQFDQQQFSVSENEENVDALLLRSAKLKTDDIENTVKIIARAGAGVNNIPVDECSQKGIVVLNTPGANANAVKELVIAGLLMASRDISGAIIYAKTLKGENEQVPVLVEKNKSKFKGNELAGKKLGVIGLGAIGIMVANSASSLNMDVIGYDPYLSVKAAWEISRKIKRADKIDELFANCDYLTIHVPLIDVTKDMINAKALNKMKKGMKILNFSRGGLVNNSDILKAINSGQVKRYITDFPSDELLNIKGITCIPHLGASTNESEVNCAIMATRQLSEFLLYGNIVNSVNMPNCSVNRTSDYRITIVHQNNSDILANLAIVFSDEKINIINHSTHIKGEYAYTIFDTNNQVNEDILLKINKISGVLSTRLLK